MSAAILAVDIPNPIQPIADGIAGVAGWAGKKAAGAVLGPVGDAIAHGLAGACDKIGTEVLHFLTASSSVHLDSGWWASPRGHRLTAIVLGLAAVFMLGFLLLALLQGLAAGDPGAMLRTAFLELPLSVAATAVLAAITQVLLGIADESSNALLSGVPDDLNRFFKGFGTAASVTSNGFAGIIMLALFLVGALLVWVELVVRSSLIYWLVAAAPLLAAARVWPAARGAWRKLVEIGCVLIFSKVAIALALGLGAAALAGGGPSPGDVGTEVGTDLSSLLVGAALMLLASFTPFVLLRILPIVEAAVVAQGISRSPARAASTAMQMGYYAAGLERMASGGRRFGLPGGGGGPTSPGSGSGPASGGGPTPPSSGGTPAAGGGANGGAATAARTPAAAAAGSPIPVGATAAARSVRRTAEQASDSGSKPHSAPTRQPAPAR